MLPSKVRTTIEVLLLALVAAFIGAIGLGVFVDVFWTAGDKPSEAFRGAFLGAFFAFLFVRVGDALTKIYERQAKGRNALIALQHRFLEVLNILNDDLFIFREVARLREALKKAPPAPVFMNTLAMLPELGDLLPLNDIDLLNELVHLNIEIKKMNDSMATWQRTNDSLKNAFIGKSLDEKTYLANMEDGCEQAVLLAQYLTALASDLVDSQAAVRLLSRRDSLLGKIIGWTTATKYPKDFERERASERARILAEAPERPDSNVRKLRSQAGKK